MFNHYHISDISANSIEQEVIINDGTKFIVEYVDEKAKDDQGRTYTKITLSNTGVLGFVQNIFKNDIVSHDKIIQMIQSLKSKSKLFAKEFVLEREIEVAKMKTE